MIHLYYHGGSKNHGCEAIVRSTKKILDSELVLFTFDFRSDQNYGVENVVRLVKDESLLLSRYSVRYLLHALYYKLHHTDYLHTKFTHPGIFSDVCRGGVYMSIGGDNYCYEGQDILSHYNQILKCKGAKTVLWGCSVEPDLVKDPKIVADLARYDLITSRETISYEALKKVNSNTILVSDPAFQLDRIDLPFPEGLVEGNTVGINISPLIMRQEKECGITEKNYVNMICKILDKTNMRVALIPHVVESGNDDREPMRRLYERFASSGRVVLIDDCNCMELKGYIARCRFFVGARTHATIAAYSSCVPTLVVGYSVKARGIARDIFGTEENYVLPVQSLKNPDDLSNRFDWMMEQEQVIRKHLQTTMPAYCKRARKGAEAVRRLIG